MKKVFLILTAFVVAFMTVPAAHADSMVKVDVANGLLKLSANPNVTIPVEAKYSELKGKPILKLDLKGGADLKGIVNARVMVNGQKIAAENVDQVGSKLVVTLDQNLLHAGSANQIVVDLGVKIAKLDLVKLQICLSLSADVMLQAKKGEVGIQLTGCKDNGDAPDAPGNDENNDDNNGGDDGTNDDGNGGKDGSDENNGGDNGSKTGGDKSGSLPNHKSGGELPKTATPYPTLSLIGFLLLFAGAGILRLKALRG